MNFEPPMKKVAIYTRISTTDKGQDLETQLLPLKEYAKAREWEIFEIYEEKISGSKECRPELQNCSQRHRNGNLIFAFALDSTVLLVVQNN